MIAASDFGIPAAPPECGMMPSILRNQRITRRWLKLGRGADWTAFDPLDAMGLLSTIENGGGGRLNLVVPDC
jgi:hypothetical protein